MAARSKPFFAARIRPSFISLTDRALLGMREIWLVKLMREANIAENGQRPRSVAHGRASE